MCNGMSAMERAQAEKCQLVDVAAVEPAWHRPWHPSLLVGGTYRQQHLQLLALFREKHGVFADRTIARRK